MGRRSSASNVLGALSRAELDDNLSNIRDGPDFSRNGRNFSVLLQRLVDEGMIKNEDMARNMASHFPGMAFGQRKASRRLRRGKPTRKRPTKRR
jgi:hypothetical protein